MNIGRRIFIISSLATTMNNHLIPIDFAMNTDKTKKVKNCQTTLFVGSPTLIEMCSQPLLIRTLYRFPPGGVFDENGAQGRNRNGIWQIEEQRVGGEFVVRGILNGRNDWCAFGWKVLDWANNHQEISGRYRSRGGHYHSTALFLDGLEQAIMADPASARSERIDHLHRAASWMALNIDDGISLNKGLTHRAYLCMSVLGRAAVLTGDQKLHDRAYDWAEIGLSSQKENGVNPELGGFDVSYQMVGPKFVLLFIPVCLDSALVSDLKRMTSRAIDWWKTVQNRDGSVRWKGSTRVGVEKNFDGTIKAVNYKETLQALVWAAFITPAPDLLVAADRLAAFARL